MLLLANDETLASGALMVLSCTKPVWMSILWVVVTTNPNVEILPVLASPAVDDLTCVGVLLTSCYSYTTSLVIAATSNWHVHRMLSVGTLSRTRGGLLLLA